MGAGTATAREYRPAFTKFCSTPAQLRSEYCRLINQTRTSAELGGEAGAKLYDAYHASKGGELLKNGKPRREQVQLVQLVQTLWPVRTSPVILEGGPGSCWVLRKLNRTHYKVHGQELSALAIKNNCAGLDVKQGFLKELKFPSRFADLFIASDVMEHIPLSDLQLVLQEIRRVTRGWVLFTVGICAKWCGTGFCASMAIHPTGFCDDRPRTWWNEQLAAAGFTHMESDKMSQLDKIVNPTEPRACSAATKMKERMFCRSWWNKNAHNYFIAKA